MIKFLVRLIIWFIDYLFRPLTRKAEKAETDKRDKKVAGVLKGMGLQKVAPKTDELFAEIRELGFFRRGHKRKFRNVYRGKIENHEIVIFDYQYVDYEQVGMDRKEIVYLQTVLGFHNDSVELPIKSKKRSTGLNFHGHGQRIIFYAPDVLLKAIEYQDALAECFTQMVRFEKRYPAKHSEDVDSVNSDSSSESEV